MLAQHLFDVAAGCLAFGFWHWTSGFGVGHLYFVFGDGRQWGSRAMFQHYINVDINFVDYNGNQYQFGNIKTLERYFGSINAIKASIRKRGNLGKGAFNIVKKNEAIKKMYLGPNMIDWDKHTRIIKTIEQLREYVFKSKYDKYEINEVPFFQIQRV